MHLESVPSIAAAKVRVEDHLLVSEVSIEVARALEVGNRCTKFCQKRCCGSVVDRWRNGTPFEGPHLHALRSPEHGEDASASGIEIRASETIGSHGTASVRIGEGTIVSQKRARLAGTSDAAIWLGRGVKGHDVAWLIVGLLDDVDFARLWPSSGSADEPECRPCTATGHGESDLSRSHWHMWGFALTHSPAGVPHQV